MQAYCDYIKEIHGAEVLQHDYGFAVFREDGQCLQIMEFYVRPQDRKSGRAQELFTELVEEAERRGKLAIAGRIGQEQKTINSALKFWLRMGGEVACLLNGEILLSKRVGQKSEEVWAEYSKPSVTS